MKGKKGNRKKEHKRHRCRSVKRTGIQGPKGQPEGHNSGCFHVTSSDAMGERKTRATCHPVQMENLSLNTHTRGRERERERDRERPKQTDRLREREVRRLHHLH